MNRQIVPPLLLASLLACAFAVSAQTVTTAVAVNAGDQAQAQLQPAGEAIVDPAATPQVPSNCLRQTGSRIVARESVPRSARERNNRLSQHCVAANGRVYSRDDIEHTGEVDLADALRKLDTSIH